MVGGEVRTITTLHTLDLALHIVDSIRRLHLKGDSLTREGLDEDLHDEDLEVEVTVSSSLCDRKRTKELLSVGDGGE